MFKQPIGLRQITYGSYRRKARGLKLLANVEKDNGRYVFTRVDSAPVYSSFSELLKDLSDYILVGDIRLLHAPGKSYSESERELQSRKNDPSFYSELEQRAEEGKALNVEFNVMVDGGTEKTYRGSKFLFRKRGELGLIYLAKAYLHKEDAELLGIYTNIKQEFHGLVAINRKCA